MKAAEDVGGQPTTARTRSFETDEFALARMIAFLGQTLPTMVGNASPLVKTCLYAMTPDRDFVLDTVEGHPGLQVALGSAHGFKFAHPQLHDLEHLARDDTAGRYSPSEI